MEVSESNTASPFAAIIHSISRTYSKSFTISHVGTVIWICGFARTGIFAFMWQEAVNLCLGLIQLCQSPPDGAVSQTTQSERATERVGNFSNQLCLFVCVRTQRGRSFFPDCYVWISVSLRALNS